MDRSDIKLQTHSAQMLLTHQSQQVCAKYLNIQHDFFLFFVFLVRQLYSSAPTSHMPFRAEPPS